MKATETKEITFTLDAKDALELYAFLAKDDTVPWGIDNGRRVAGVICEKLRKFLGR